MSAYSMEIIPFGLRAKAGVISFVFMRAFVVLGRYVPNPSTDRLRAGGNIV